MTASTGKRPEAHVRQALDAKATEYRQSIAGHCARCGRSIQGAGPARAGVRQGGGVSTTVVTAWGEEPLGAPDQHARVFAYAHFSAGHRYTVTGEPGALSVKCQCGKRYAAGNSTVVYP